MDAFPSQLSKSRVNKAGQAIRGYAEGRLDLTADELEEERAVVAQFRKAHGPALSRVAANLRYYVRKNSELMILGQRLKRTPTIIDKLFRHPEMQLARMHDIAGCRAVVESNETVYAIVEALDSQRRWDIVRSYDYIEAPKDDGYRAVHLVVRKTGMLVEVQLRSKTHHSWAEVVEAEDRARPMARLKEGRAPQHVVEYYRLGAALLESQERGLPADPVDLDRFRWLHARMNQSRSRRKE